MLKVSCLIVALISVTPLWSQVEPSATGGALTPDGDLRMRVPPAVSGEAYPREVGSEERSNFLAGGLVFTSAYIDNLLQASSSAKISDETYSILPTLRVERKTPKQTQSVNYNTGFTFYQHTSDLNDIAQNLTADYQFRLSKYSTVRVQDSFQQNSNSYNQSNPTASGAVSGSPGATHTAVLVPFQNQLTNSVNGGVTYQFAKNSMIGGSGYYSLLHYGNLSNVPGLNQSDTSGGAGFYSRRLARSQYFGGTYSYSRTNTHPVASTTDTHAILGFYTIYFDRAFSLSILAGPQRFDAEQPPFAPQKAWTPAVVGSIGWQTPRSNLAVSYSRLVNGGGGLLGAYHTDNGTASARRQITRSWNSELNAGYTNLKSATPMFTSSNQGGHTIFGTVSIEHSFNRNLTAMAGYGHYHQSYGGIAAFSPFPDSNRVFVSVAYQFIKPLGR